MSGGSHNYISYAINGALFKDRFENRIDNHYKNVCDERIARIAREPAHLLMNMAQMMIEFSVMD